MIYSHIHRPRNKVRLVSHGPLRQLGIRPNIDDISWSKHILVRLMLNLCVQELCQRLIILRGAMITILDFDEILYFGKLNPSGLLRHVACRFHGSGEPYEVCQASSLSVYYS